MSIQYDQLVDDNARSKIGSESGEKLENQISLVDDKLQLPLDISLLGTILTVEAGTKQQKESDGSGGQQDSYKLRLPLLNNVDVNPIQSTLNFADGDTTGDFEDDPIVSPVMVASEYVQFGIELRTDKKLYGVWGEPNAVLANTTPPAFSKSSLQMLIVKLQDDGTGGQWNFTAPTKSDLEVVIKGGSGGGSGDANSLLNDYKTMLSQSIYDLLSYAIFDIDTDEKTDIASTASLSFASSPVTYKFLTGQTFITTDLIDPEFTNDPLQVDVQVSWDLAKLDDNATYEITRDGGTTWETMTLVRADNSNTYFGTHVFDTDVTVSELQVRVTASQDDVELQGIGVYYDPQPASSGTEALKYQSFSVNTGDQEVTLTLTDFIPVEELLEIHVPIRGQVYKAINTEPLLPTINGMDVVFPTDFFYDLPAENLAVLLVQNSGQTIDTNDSNGALLAENSLGSESASLDKSVAGKGIKLRRPDGTLRELTIDDNDNISIKSLP